MNKLGSWFDAYELKARVVPAALCAIPAVVLYHYLLHTHFDGLFTTLSHMQLLGYVTIEAAMTYAVVQLNNRLGGKILQSIIFRNGRVPTTRLLMPSDPTLSLETKHDIADKFQKEFQKELPLFDQNITDAERRKRVSELMAYIRNVTRTNLLVRNHNIEYGFIRNLCGGSLIAAVVSAASAIIFGIFAWNKDALSVSLGLLVIYGLITIASKPLISYFGENYAKILFEQYLCN